MTFTSWLKARRGIKKRDKVDVLKDTSAIIEFLGDAKVDIKDLQEQFDKLEGLEKERQTASSHLSKTNLHTQADLIDTLLLRYESFHTDTAINYIRLKMIADEWMRLAKKEDLQDLVKEKKKKSHWSFDW
tara:strand:- start:8 stop:397 length:390 start_codon:yes stop_codon:yes gene_type:complete